MQHTFISNMRIFHLNIHSFYNSKSNQTLVYAGKLSDQRAYDNFSGSWATSCFFRHFFGQAVQLHLWLQNVS